MTFDFSALLAAGDGLVPKRLALRSVSHDVLDLAVRSKRLIQLFPRVYVAPDRVDEPRLRWRAALVTADQRAALSHLSALASWGLPTVDDAPVHLVTDDRRHLRGGPGLVVHRRLGFAPEAPHVLYRDGALVTTVERAVIDSWPLMHRDAKRAPAIAAVARRKTTPGRLREVLKAVPRLPGRALFRELLTRLEAGCRSPLEIWGYDHIFNDSVLPALRWQTPVRIGRRTVYLDVYAERERVNFELDGTKWHSSHLDRERDLRRDAALAALGIMVVRYSHDRLVNEPDAVRDEVRTILRTRLAA